MRAKHLIIFVLAHCSIKATAKQQRAFEFTSPSVSRTSVLLAYESCLLSANTIDAQSTATYPLTPIETKLISIKPCIGNYLFDVELKINKGEYHRYILNDIDVQKLKIKRASIDPMCPSH